MPLSKISDSAKIFVIRALATYCSPTTVANQLYQEYGIELKRQSIEHYDPNKNLKLPRKWRDIFEQERARFWRGELRSHLDVRFYRQKLRHQLIQRNKNNPRLQRELINDAAKDVGGLFTCPHLRAARARAVSERQSSSAVSNPENVKEMSTQELKVAVVYLTALNQLSPEQLERITKITQEMITESA